MIILQNSVVKHIMRLNLIKIVFRRFFIKIYRVRYILMYLCWVINKSLVISDEGGFIWDYMI